MLSHIDVHNYQSLHHVSLDLGQFTVIEGASDSGKSALTRALRALTSNQRGDSFITHGETQTSITGTTERGTVTLNRGKDNSYVVIPSSPHEAQREYTKLSGQVPEQVSEFLGIAAKDPLNYSDQFDMPYLLKTSAGETARVLGELTNVHIIFEAAREANKRRGNKSATLKVKTADLDTIKAKAERYKNLKTQIAAIEQAEESLEKISSLERKKVEIERALQTAEIAQSALKDLQEIASIELPSPDKILEARDRLQAFKTTIGEIRSASETLKSTKTAGLAADEEIARLEAERLSLLSQAGTCPTCGQGTKHLHNDYPWKV